MTERHMQTNAPLSWWPGKGNDFLCPSKQHPHDWSILGAEPCCGLTWSQDGRFYNRHCPLRFCLHGWPLLLNHKHLLTLSDDLMFALLSAEVLLVNLMQRVSLVLEPEMWWKLQLQHEKLDNQGGGDNRPGTNHASFWEKSVHCMQEGKKPGANELS